MLNKVLAYRRGYLIIMAAGTAAILSFWGVKSLNSQVVSSPGQWTPFTMILTETISNVPSKRTVTGRTIFKAVTLDGSRAEGDSRSPGQPGYYGVRSVQLPSELKEVTIDEVLKAKSTRLLSREQANRSGQPPSDLTCTKSNVVSGVSHSVEGESTILGLRTVRIRLAYDNVVQTHWLAPDLNCTAIRFEEQLKDEKGTVTDRFERTASSIKLGQPEASLFTIPAHYKESSPWQLRQASARLQGRTVPQEPHAAMKIAEDRYYEAIENAIREGRSVPGDVQAVLRERQSRINPR